MPTINNVRLTIDPVEDRRFRLVIVQYQVCFSACEALDESVFVERVVLRGKDFPPFDPDNDLITLRNRCVRAQQGCVDRAVRAIVSAGTLDEDDSIFFGGDEIYARVTMKPFVPGQASQDSNLVTGQFGS